jgi:hypothetical protein
MMPGYPCCCEPPEPDPIEHCCDLDPRFVDWLIEFVGGASCGGVTSENMAVAIDRNDCNPTPQTDDEIIVHNQLIAHLECFGDNFTITIEVFDGSPTTIWSDNFLLSDVVLGVPIVVPRISGDACADIELTFTP